MDKVNIFISSTFRDLETERKNLEGYISKLGHNAICHESNGIFYNPNENTHTSCIRTVEETADILVLIIDSRFGGQINSDSFNHIDLEKLKNKSNYQFFFSQEKKYSITQCEVLKAVELNIPVITFVHKSISDKRHMYEKFKKDKKNIKDPTKIEYFDNIEDNKNASYIFEFIKFINNLKINNGIKDYNTLEDVLEYLKDYLSAHFKSLIKNQPKIHEERITDLKSSSQAFELIPKNFPIESIFNYFTRESIQKRSIQSMNIETIVDKNGSCNILSVIEVKPLDTLTHHNYHIYIDKPGIIKVEEFRVVDMLHEAEYFGIKTDKYLRLNLFFVEPKKKKEFKIHLKIQAENFISDLIDKGRGEIDKKLSSGEKKFKYINETIIFPNVKLFKKLKVKISKHPDPKKIGSFVNFRNNNNNKIYVINFQKEDNQPFNDDIKIEFTLE